MGNYLEKCGCKRRQKNRAIGGGKWGSKEGLGFFFFHLREISKCLFILKWIVRDSIPISIPWFPDLFPQSKRTWSARDDFKEDATFRMTEPLWSGCPRAPPLPPGQGGQPITDEEVYKTINSLASCFLFLFYNQRTSLYSLKSQTIPWGFDNKDTLSRLTP